MKLRFIASLGELRFAHQVDLDILAQSSHSKLASAFLCIDLSYQLAHILMGLLGVTVLIDSGLGGPPVRSVPGTLVSVVSLSLSVVCIDRCSTFFCIPGSL